MRQVLCLIAVQQSFNQPATAAAHPPHASPPTLITKSHLTLQFIWGGRNDTAYFEDGWSFSLSNHSWTELHADPAVHQPRARDHLGAFYHDGSVWIYGTCLYTCLPSCCEVPVRGFGPLLRHAHKAVEASVGQMLAWGLAVVQ